MVATGTGCTASLQIESPQGPQAPYFHRPFEKLDTMQPLPYVHRVVDLTDPSKNVLFGISTEEARAAVAAGDAQAVGKIEGQFALLGTSEKLVRMARSIGRPLRYFVAKRSEGPCLIAAERIDTIYRFLQAEGLADQFHPSYTRMVPAHHITEVALVGCPDPSPNYQRFFTPSRASLPPDLASIGEAYMRAVQHAIEQWLTTRATSGPIGVAFSGGIDSTSVLLLAYDLLVRKGLGPARLKAFTLSVDGGGADLAQARELLQSLGLDYLLEPIEVHSADVSWKEAVQVMEDYKPLDVQSATMNLALCRGIRQRYPDWKYLLDGDGGDENLKDYPIEENPELTIGSILNNLMLYQEGWGVHAIKHSLTYSGGLSRGYLRTYATAAAMGFDGFSPYTLPQVIAIAEGIPFIELTQWDHDRLYQLKGQIVSAGIKAVTGFDMPIFPKRRFQHGAGPEQPTSELFPRETHRYRRHFLAGYEQA